MSDQEHIELSAALADRLEGRWALHPEMQEAAAELRRLHAEIESLRREQEEDQCAIRVWRRRADQAEAKSDAMQERVEYWKRKHDDEETGAERYALRVQRDELLAALRVFVSCALPVSTEIDERGHRWTEAYLDQALLNARAAIKAVEGEKA